jgi:hypothetical protein
MVFKEKKPLKNKSLANWQEEERQEEERPNLVIA